MIITTDIEERITEVVAFMTNLDMSDGIHLIAVNIVDLQKQRIGSGIGSNGGIMDTHSANRVGRYSKQQARKKSNPNIRNLSDSGDMLADYGVQSKGHNFAEIGFNSILMADRAEYNEAYMGQQAFDASPSEIGYITDTFDSLFEQKFI